MKPFPVKVVKDTINNFYDITWKVHNECPYDCSFCSPEFKDGTDKHLTLDEYKSIVDNIVIAAGDKPIWMTLTGGEPTVIPDFLELALYIKSRGIYLGLLSNGIRTIRWWKELKDANVLDNLTLTFHPDQGASYTHFTEILNLFMDKETATTCWITVTKDSIPDAIKAHSYLKANTGAEIILKEMDIHGYNIKEYTDKYPYFKINHTSKGVYYANKKQSTIPEGLSNIRNIVNVHLDDGTIKTLSTQATIREGLNFFEGWNCYIGKHQAFLDRYKMHRGACFHSTDEFIDLRSYSARFPEESIVCRQQSCLCGPDIVADKNINAK